MVIHECVRGHIFGVSRITRFCVQCGEKAGYYKEEYMDTSPCEADVVLIRDGRMDRSWIEFRVSCEEVGRIECGDFFAQVRWVEPKTHCSNLEHWKLIVNGRQIKWLENITP